MDKEMFLGVARLNSEEFPMGCVHVNLCVLAENQWTACKRAEEHLKKHFYYNKGELIFLELHQIYDPESVSNASIEFIP